MSNRVALEHQGAHQNSGWGRSRASGFRSRSPPAMNGVAGRQFTDLGGGRSPGERRPPRGTTGHRCGGRCPGGGERHCGTTVHGSAGADSREGVATSWDSGSRMCEEESREVVATSRDDGSRIRAWLDLILQGAHHAFPSGSLGAACGNPISPRATSMLEIQQNYFN